MPDLEQPVNNYSQLQIGRRGVGWLGNNALGYVKLLVNSLAFMG